MYYRRKIRLYLLEAFDNELVGTAVYQKDGSWDRNKALNSDAIKKQLKRIQ